MMTAKLGAVDVGVLKVKRRACWNLLVEIFSRSCGAVCKFCLRLNIRTRQVQEGVSRSERRVAK